LTPVNLEVESGYEVGKGPPKLDVLNIRRTGKCWSKAQLEFLPDGIRQSNSKHVILELKYISKFVLNVLMYDCVKILIWHLAKIFIPYSVNRSCMKYLQKISLFR